MESGYIKARWHNNKGGDKMKTYDIYAKQEGKWQRKGIQGEPTLPEYDGTVIIEKAESEANTEGVSE